MKPNVLMAWIGLADLDVLKAKQGEGVRKVGPIAQALYSPPAQNYSHAFLLSAIEKKKASEYVTWLQNKFPETQVKLHQSSVKSPTYFKEIYEEAKKCVEGFRKEFASGTSLTFHLSPGTPIMAIVWTFLAKTQYPAELIISSVPELGVIPVSLPFDMTIDYVPDIFEAVKTGPLATAPPGFERIIYRSDIIRDCIKKAQKCAIHDNMPVLILGDSGTGKELFAEAIHLTGPRKDNRYIPINCAAIPESLLESELFGYEKGAFTGAISSKHGKFEIANKGTIFLDEIADMSPRLQVKLLRAIENNKIERLGGENSIKVDVRIIAATNKNIRNAVEKGLFREDLFHRIYGFLLRLPSLSERIEDLDVLIDYFLDRGNKTYKETTPGWKQKKLSNDARQSMHDYSWPGNVRELQHAVLRAAVYARGEVINAKDVREAMYYRVKHNAHIDGVIPRFTQDFSLKDALNDHARMLITQAFLQVKNQKGKKNKVTKMLGLKNHQNLQNWLTRLNINEEDIFSNVQSAEKKLW